MRIVHLPRPAHRGVESTVTQLPLPGAALASRRPSVDLPPVRHIDNCGFDLYGPPAICTCQYALRRALRRMALHRKAAGIEVVRAPVLEA